MDEPVSRKVHSHVVDFPEAPEKDEVTFLEASAAYGFSAAILVHLGGAVVQRDAVITFVDLHHVAGTVRFGLGGHGVTVFCSEPLTRVAFETPAGGGLGCCLGGFFLVDGGTSLFCGIQWLFGGIRNG